jgi:microcystin degradation protein MlrC
MKIFAAGIAQETNTFSPKLTAYEDYAIQRGSDAREGRVEHPGQDLTRLWGDTAVTLGHEFTFSLMAWASPGGTTLRSAYERLRDEILDDLEAAMPVDIVLLNLHGAMIAQDYDDCELDLIQMVRAIIGPLAKIGVELDLHCHLSEDKIAAADVVVTYKEYPHTDIKDRAAEVLDLTISARVGTTTPVMALFDCRMAGFYPVTASPMREFVDALYEAESRPGILSVSFGHGFPFGDVPTLGAKMLIVTDGNRALAEEVAKEFGLQVHRIRREIGFDAVSLPLDVALSRAVAGSRRPVVVADQSDNSGGGAPGDSTFALRWVLDHGVEQVASAIYYDPEVVSMCRKAGAGAEIDVRLGGKVGAFSGMPIDLKVSVLGVRKDYQHVFPQTNSEALTYPAGDVVALRYGTIDLIVSSEPIQCMSPSIFEEFGIDLAQKSLILVKSFQHFYGAFAPIAGEIIYMSAPGAVPPDPKLIPYKRFVPNDFYPWSSAELPV